MGDNPTTTDAAALRAAGFDALLRQAWGEAAEQFEAALAVETTADALEGFAAARWWLDDVGAAIEAREQAYALRREAGDTVEAAYDAAFLAWDHGAMRGSSAVASGWLQRARRLVDELPPAGEHAWLSLIEASFHIDTDATTVLRLSSEAEVLAHDHGALDIEMTARTLRGLAMVTLGQVAEGMRLLDEGAAAATGGELHDPLAIGSCLCNMIIACERSRDFDRAGQWCERLSAYAERSGQRPLLALCRAHHGTVMTIRGDWGAAEADLGWAASELATLRPPVAGYARARLAELRRRQGRPADARSLLDEAEGHVLAPLGRAALALDEDDLSTALGHAERYLRRIAGDRPVDGAAAWELLVPIQVGRDELGLGHEAHEHLAGIADAVGTDPLRAAERHAAGRLALADDDPDAARRALEDAVDLHIGSVEPFEGAVARLALADALAAEDRADGGRRAGRPRRRRLRGPRGRPGPPSRPTDLARRLGARPRRAGRAHQAGAGGARPGRRRALEPRDGAEMIVSEHTVHRHVANIFTKLGVSSRAAAVATAAERGLLA